MKKTIISLSLLALTACGGGETPATPETTTPDSSIPTVILPDSVISGDITLSDDGSNILTGKVTLTEGASFIAQNNTETTLGKFSITTDGSWKYEPNRNPPSYVELPDSETITEAVTVTTSDGQTNTITITLVGKNDPAEFSSGNGIDSANYYTNTSDKLTGNIIFSDPDTNESSLVKQDAIQGDFGIFTMTESGLWSYTFTDESLNAVSARDVFKIKSLDGSEHQVTIFIVPVAAEIHAESLEAISGTINLVSSETASIIEQSNTQGAFGRLTISTTGEWTYSMTNLASDIVAPRDVFTVTTVNGTEYKMAIKVNGLFQRLTSIKSMDGEFEYFEYGTAEYDLYGYEKENPLSINDLFDYKLIQSAQENPTAPVFFEYDIYGDLKKKQEFTVESSTFPYEERTYNYEYSDNELTSFDYEELRYNSPGENALLDRKYTNEYQIVDEQVTNIYYSVFDYYETEETPVLSLNIDYTYNELGQLYERYRSYFYPEDIEVDDLANERQLHYQYFYDTNGNIDYRNTYRRSTTNYRYEGINSQRNYYYTSENRLSHRESNYGTAVENEEGVYVYGDFDSTSLSAYSYLDELDIALAFTVKNESTNSQEAGIYDVSIYQYEDVDQCNDSLIMIDSIVNTLPHCRVKVANASTIKSELLDTIGLDVPAEFGEGIGVDSASLITSNTDNISGKLSVFDLNKGESAFIVQDGAIGALGIFYITESGEWSYTFTHGSADYSTSQEVFSVSSVDGSTHNISITVMPNAEITAEIGASISEHLESDVANTDNYYVEQLNTQGAFGTFSISASGDWSYTITNLASDYIPPEEEFTVSSIDGEEHQITILVKGLYQRIVKKHSFGSEYWPGVSLSNLKEQGYIQFGASSPDYTYIYKYDELGNISQVEGYTFSWGEMAQAPYYILDYQYEYIEEKLSSVSSEKDVYNVYINEPSILNSKTIIDYNILEDERADYSLLLYKHDELGENPELDINRQSSYNYNVSGQTSNYSVTYLDSDTTTIEAAYANPQLSTEYFYNSNGTRDYYLGYKVSDDTIYQGARWDVRYVYDSEERLSHTLSYEAEVELIDEVYVYDDIPTEASKITVYHYMDELDFLVTYTATSEEYNNTGSVSRAYIYQYEDTDQCGQYHIFLAQTNKLNIPECRIKNENSYSDSTELPNELP